MMELTIFVLAAVLQVITAQGPGGPPPPFPDDLPEVCKKPPETDQRPHECCKIPPFFTDEDFTGCGFKKIDENGPPRRGPPDCSKQLCIMKKYNMLKDDSTIDLDAVSAFMDSWAEKNEVFKPAVENAKKKCLTGELPGPPQICEANKIVFCTTSTLFGECPVWEQTDGCKKVKAHMEECAPFFKPKH